MSPMLSPHIKESTLTFGPSGEHKLKCKYTIWPDGQFDMANTGCKFEVTNS